MAKIRDLPELTTAELADLLYIVDFSAGPNGGRKITAGNLKTSLSLTAAEIKSLYESNPDTNAFTDAEQALVGLITGKLDKAGDTMSGVLNMGSNKISGLAAPTLDADAATKKYVDDGIANLSWKEAVLDKDLFGPPAIPGTGQRYIVASPASGLWFGHDKEIAEWNGTAWIYTSPVEGDTVHVIDEDSYYHFNGALTWEKMESKFDHSLLKNLNVDSHVQYLLVSGTRAMSGNLDMGGQSIINVNLVDGIDVTSHGSRHNPGGADAVSTAAAVGINANSTNTEGVAGTLARSDHTHDLATGSAVGINANSTNTEGTSVNLARADHTHDLDTAAAVGINANSTNTEGTSASLARADHTHDLATGAASAQSADAINAEGTSVNLARADHIHNIATGAPVNTGSANAQGSSGLFAKADHVHNTTVANSVASATTTDTTTSLTDTLVNSMTITPAAGTYLVRFQTSTVNSGNGAERNFFSVYAGGSQVPYSEIRVGIGGGSTVPASTQATVTVNGSQAIEIRWRVAGGTGSAYQRSMSVLRIGD